MRPSPIRLARISRGDGLNERPHSELLAWQAEDDKASHARFNFQGINQVIPLICLTIHSASANLKDHNSRMCKIREVILFFPRRAWQCLATLAIRITVNYIRLLVLPVERNKSDS